MEPKPDCSTCPHGHPLKYGKILCQLRPPVFVDNPAKEEAGYEESGWAQPIVSVQTSCSHHPDFPAWLASRAKPAGPDAPGQLKEALSLLRGFARVCDAISQDTMFRRIVDLEAGIIEAWQANGWPDPPAIWARKVTPPTAPPRT